MLHGNVIRTRTSLSLVPSITQVVAHQTVQALVLPFFSCLFLFSLFSGVSVLSEIVRFVESSPQLTLPNLCGNPNGRYALSGQKCSAQSMMFAHANWMAPEVGLINKMADRAAMRSLADLTNCPVLTWTNEARAPLIASG